MTSYLDFTKLECGVCWRRVELLADRIRNRLIDKFGPFFEVRFIPNTVSGRTGWVVFTNDSHVYHSRVFCAFLLHDEMYR